MELKSYQKKVIADLTRYLELLNETKSDAAAFRLFWQEKSAPTLGRYQNVIPGVPNLCFKVPTGGGKTFIACNAVRPIFDALPATKTKAVVWLVPSDAILTQTAKHYNAFFDKKIQISPENKKIHERTAGAVLQEDASRRLILFKKVYPSGEAYRSWQRRGTRARFRRARSERCRPSAAPRSVQRP